MNLMVVITRTFGESIQIGSEIMATFLASSAGDEVVQIAVQMPDDIFIARKEIYDRVLKETQLQDDFGNRPL
jgi:carbon storage regulator CsrA